MAQMPYMTLPELRTAVRRRADMEHSDFVSDDELTGYVNESLFSLYDLLVTTYGEDYFADEVQRTTDGTEFVDLPDDFYKLLGVDLLVSGRRVTLRPFNRGERNRASFELAHPYVNTRYRLRADKLWLTPAPSSGQTLAILYVPRRVPLSDAVKITVGSVIAGDTVTLEGYASVVAGTDFAIGATNALTASNLAAALQEGDFADTANFGVSVHGSEVTITQETPVNGSTEWTTSSDVRLALSGGVRVGQHGGRLAPAHENTVSDGISGWLEYVVLDAAVKCLQKEESDTKVIERQRAQLIQRINDSAPNRDAGEPFTVTDVTRTGAWDDFDMPLFGHGY